ncbi:MAG: hypothetical protein NC389_17125 [Acetatifactor muris]|nr:hypothetical protein [Acetatifactor muris]
MARKPSDENMRKNTEKTLKRMLANRNLTSQIYLDKIDEYMSFYDNLNQLNQFLKSWESVPGFIKKYTDAVSEKRRVSSEMRSILSFLGLKPGENSVYDEPEKL